MAYPQNNRRRRRNWISYLFPLAFLLIFFFTRSFAGLLASIAIIVLLWAFISLAPLSSDMQNTPPLPVQSPDEPLYTPPEPPMPYEQGYMGVGSTGQYAQQQQRMATSPSQPFSYQTPLQESSAEGDRLAKLKQLGDLYHSGKLTQEEFESQKQRILQADVTKEATEQEGAFPLSSQIQYEEQPQAQYPEELPPMQH